MDYEEELQAEAHQGTGSPHSVFRARRFITEEPQVRPTRLQKEIWKAPFGVRTILLAAFLLVMLTFAGCGSSGGGGGGGGDPDAGPFEPQYHESRFHADEAEGSNNAAIDLSATEDGYVGVAAVSSSRLKFQVIHGEETYNYDIASDGTPSIFPLQCGDGTYSFKVMENVMDNKYAELYSTSADVKLKDEYQPYLRPSAYVNYDENSDCVKKASEIVAKGGSEMDVVSEIYDYICDNVTYDEEKAASVESGYMPSPDETLTTGKGICFDYASLAAAMLRSQGIPTKVIFGYVAPDNLYHAWNMFYTEETGWVTVDYEVDEESWNRLDLTFAANGADSDFIGDGSHYSDVYIY